MTRLQKLQEMLADEPNDPVLRYMLAMEYVSQGDDTAAVHGFLNLVELTPDYAPAYHQGARALARLNRLEEARAVLKKGIPLALGQGNEHAAGEMQGLLESLE